MTARSRAGLSARDVIAQTKGMLIDRFSISEDQTFAMLVRSSQDTNIKLRKLAQWLLNEIPRGRPGHPPAG